MASLREAKTQLKESEHTLVAILPAPGGQRTYASDEKGLAPILVKMQLRRKYFKDAYVADRVVGKAAAMLLVASGARGIYAEVMSAAAKKFLETVLYDRSMGRNNSKLVEFEARTTVPFIMAPTSSLLHPAEAAVEELSNYDEAQAALQEFSVGAQE